MNNYITFSQYVLAQLIYGTIMGILIGKLINYRVETEVGLWLANFIDMYVNKEMEEKENDKK